MAEAQVKAGGCCMHISQDSICRFLRVASAGRFHSTLRVSAAAVSHRRWPACVSVAVAGVTRC